LTVNGTNGDDAITQNGNQITVNNGAVVSFIAYPTLQLNGNNGDDTISTAPATLTGVSTFIIDGGDPTASDTVLVNGTTGADAVTIDTLTTSGARITGLGPTVNVSTAEGLHYNGIEGGDTLTITTPAGLDAIAATPTLASGEGS